MLRDQKSIWTTLYEINEFPWWQNLQLASRSMFPGVIQVAEILDAKASIYGTELNIECKTRKDDFPFTMLRILEGPERIPIHSGSKSTLDPHDAAELGLGFDFPDSDPSFKTTPASTEVRQIMSKGLAQLPAMGCNVILLRELGFGNHIDEALFGTELFYFHKEAATRQYLSHWTRAPTGACCTASPGEPFRQLSGILWFRLFSASGSEYNLYVNPNAISPIPDDVVTSLNYIIGQWTSLKRREDG